MNSKLYVCLWIVLLLLLPRPSAAQDRDAEDLRALGKTAFYEGRYDDAERYFRKSLSVFELRGDRALTDIAGTRGDLGWSLVFKGSYREAEQLLDSGIRVLGKGSDETCKKSIILSHLGSLYQLTGRYARAESVFKKALKQSESCEPSYRAAILNGLGVLYIQMDKRKPAAAVLENALALLQKHPGGEGYTFVLAQTLTGLAALQQAQGKFPVAEELFTRAVELFGGSSHDGPAGLARTFLSIALEGLGGVHFRQGRLDVAEQEFERSWHNEMMRSGGADPVRLAILNAELAEVLTARGRYEDAKGLYQQALRGSTKESAETATLLEPFSKLLRIMNADGQAEEMEFRARRIRAGLTYTTKLK